MAECAWIALNGDQGLMLNLSERKLLAEALKDSTHPSLVALWRLVRTGE